MRGGEKTGTYDAYAVELWTELLEKEAEAAKNTPPPLLTHLSEMPRLTQPRPPAPYDVPDEAALLALRAVLEKEIDDQNSACFGGKTVMTATINGKSVEDKLWLVSCVLQGEAGRLDIQLPSIESLVGNSKELHDDGKLLGHEKQARSCRPDRGPRAPQSDTPILPLCRLSATRTCCCDSSCPCSRRR